MGPVLTKRHPWAGSHRDEAPPSARIWHRPCSFAKQLEAPAGRFPMRILTLALMIALLAPVRLAALQKDADEAVGRRVAQAVRTYSRFTIFDDVTVHVEDQHVTLKGRVTLPVKKDRKSVV